MTDFLRPQQPTEAEQAAERFASADDLKRVGPMPAAPLSALPAASGNGANETAANVAASPPSAEQHPASPVEQPATQTPTRPFERVPVPKASVKNGEEKDAEIKKKKKPSPLFTRFYMPTFLFLISGAVIGGYLLLDPIIHSLKNTNQLINAHQQESNDATAYLNSIKRSIDAAQSIPPDILKKVDQALPRDVDQPRLLATMEAFGEKMGISLDSVQFSAESVSQSASTPATPSSAAPVPSGISTLEVNPIHIGLNVTSPSYTAARVFLQDIEQSIPILDVSRISVSGDATTGEFTYQIDMKTYSLVKAAKPTVTASPTPAPPAAGAAGAENTP